jgi:hypothetical protein
MTLAEAITKAKGMLPGSPAPEGELDPRWQATIAVAEFIEDAPESVWTFAERWGQYPDDDLRAAIATCVLEHLLEHHLDRMFPRVEHLTRSSLAFAETLTMCWPFGEATRPEKAARLNRLLRELGSAS